MTYRPRMRPIIAKPENVPTIQPFGLEMKVLLSAEATDGAISVVMAWHKPGEGPPDHVHFSQDEMFFIVTGTYDVTVGNHTAKIGPGGVVFIPRDTVHRFKNVGETTACMLDWSLPGGQDRYFKTIAERSTDIGFTGETALAISRQFDTHFPGAH